MANTIERDIRMKEDVASNHASKKLPMLDVQMWTQNNRIRYSFYEKPMVSRLVIMEKSALPMKVKIQILAQEVVRRRRNCDGKESRSEVDKEMSRFMLKLKASGYCRETRWEILKAGTRRYNRMVRDDEDGRRSLNRPRWEGGHGRYWQKLSKKKNWFRKKH